MREVAGFELNDISKSRIRSFWEEKKKKGDLPAQAKRRADAVEEQLQFQNKTKDRKNTLEAEKRGEFVYVSTLDARYRLKQEAKRKLAEKKAKKKLAEEKTVPANKKQ